MDFNKLVKSIIEPTLLLFKFTVGKEMKGIVEYEHKLVKFLFSYDYNSSYEVSISLLFKESNMIYEYNQLKVLFCNKNFDLIAFQVKDEGSLVKWLQTIRKKLQENINEIVNDSANVEGKLEKIRQLQADAYQQEKEIKRLNELVDTYWKTKDYQALVNLVNNYDKPVEGSVKMKYDYAIKNL